MTTLTQISNQQAHAVTVNDNFEAVSPSALFGVKESLTTGLTFAYYGGIIGGFGAFSTIADGTVALTGSATNYIEATTAGVVSKNTSAFTAGRVPLYTAVTSASAITTLTDYRVLSSAFFTGGAGFATLTLTRQTSDPAAPSASTGIVYLKGASDAAIEAYFKRPDATVLTLAHLEGAQTFTGALTLTSAVPQLTLGVLNTTSGGILMYGSTSGSLTLKPAAVAGAGVTITLPATSVILNAAGDLSGATLAAGVTASSLTSLGTIAALVAGTGTFTEAVSIHATSSTVQFRIGVTPTGTGLDIEAIENSGVVFDVNDSAKTVRRAIEFKQAGISVLAISSVGAVTIPGTLAVTGAITGASYSGGAISGTTITGSGTAYIGDTSNANATLGLTINQAGADNEILSLKSSDVAHGITTLTETDTYGVFKKFGATTGGVQLDGYSSGTCGLYLGGIHTTDDTTKSTAGRGTTRISAGLKSGTTGGACGADANILTIDNWGTTRFIFDAEGSGHADVEWVAFDDYHDLSLVDALQTVAMGQITPPRYGNSLYYHREFLESSGIVGKDSWHIESGRPRAMVNFSKLAMLHHGALLQLGDSRADMDRRLSAIEAKLH